MVRIFSFTVLFVYLTKLLGVEGKVRLQKEMVKDRRESGDRVTAWEKKRSSVLQTSPQSTPAVLSHRSSAMDVNIEQRYLL